jgi:hypothetical protein
VPAPAGGRDAAPSAGTAPRRRDASGAPPSAIDTEDSAGDGAAGTAADLRDDRDAPFEAAPTEAAPTEASAAEAAPDERGPVRLLNGSCTGTCALLARCTAPAGWAGPGPVAAAKGEAPRAGAAAPDDGAAARSGDRRGAAP